MAVDLESLPHDPIALREMVTNGEIENAGLRAEIDKLHLMIKGGVAEVSIYPQGGWKSHGGLQRHRFGRRSEQIDPEQLQLVMEYLEQTAAAGEAAADALAQATPVKPDADKPIRKQRRRNLGQLPASLPRIEVTVDLEDKSCACCGGMMHRVGGAAKGSVGESQWNGSAKLLKVPTV